MLLWWSKPGVQLTSKSHLKHLKWAAEQLGSTETPVQLALSPQSVTAPVEVAHPAHHAPTWCGLVTQDKESKRLSSFSYSFWFGEAKIYNVLVHVCVCVLKVLCRNNIMGSHSGSIIKISCGLLFWDAFSLSLLLLFHSLVICEGRRQHSMGQDSFYNWQMLLWISSKIIRNRPDEQNLKARGEDVILRVRMGDYHIPFCLHHRNPKHTDLMFHSCLISKCWG